MQDRSRSDSLRGRASGIIIGSLIAFGWAFYSLAVVSAPLRFPLIAAAGAITAALLRSGLVVARRARALPGADAEQKLVNRRAWRLFWLNLAAEIILLNLALNLLNRAGAPEYLLPAISAIVGLHFWPMAWFFRIPGYWWVGGAMMAGAAVTTLLIALDGAPVVPSIHGEGMLNAVILWLALAVGAWACLRGDPRQQDSATRG